MLSAMIYNLSLFFLKLSAMMLFFFLIYIPGQIFFTLFIAFPLYVALKVFEAFQTFRYLIYFVQHSIRVWQRLRRLFSALQKVERKIRKLSTSELLRFLLKTILEIIFSIPNGDADESSEGHRSSVEPLPQWDNSQLISYEEFSYDESIEDNSKFKRSVRSMHHFIPHQPFRATVRMTPLATASAFAVAERIDGADSPASFPSTPFSRTEIMNQTTEKVDSVMFAARDRLRLEAQSVSRDEFSRKVAVDAQSSGQLATFDPSQVTSGITLSCGNHCAAKTGNGTCSGVRSMVPVMRNQFVYMEFSVTVSSGQTPQLGIGLSTNDCPLNVMIGSWSSSFGLFYEGQLYAGSVCFQPTRSIRFEAGCTIGMLVHLTSPPQPTSSPLPPSSVSAEILPENQKQEDKSQEGGRRGEAVPSVQTIPKRKGEERNTVIFNLNGSKVIFPDDAVEQMARAVSSDLPFFPTVSIFSPNTRVWCRFCEADIVFRNRKVIGAPPGSPVYCLDGTLLLAGDQ